MGNEKENRSAEKLQTWHIMRPIDLFIYFWFHRTTLFPANTENNHEESVLFRIIHEKHSFKIRGGTAASIHVTTHHSRPLTLPVLLWARRSHSWLRRVLSAAVMIWWHIYYTRCFDCHSDLDVWRYSQDFRQAFLSLSLIQRHRGNPTGL